jgi:hypothetical protein
MELMIFSPQVDVGQKSTSQEVDGTCGDGRRKHDYKTEDWFEHIYLNRESISGSYFNSKFCIKQIWQVEYCACLEMLKCDKMLKWK